VEHFQWESGLRLGPEGRYVVERLLGDGVFGRVLGCRDRVSRDFVAIKVAGSAKRSQKQAQREADALLQLERRDPGRYSRFCPRLLGTFMHADQGICLVFQPLASSLQNVMKQCGDRGLFLTDVHAIARQLLAGLAFVHRSGLAHTDIKCTNVMLRDAEFEVVAHPRWPSPAEAPRMRRPCEAVLIDFGGAAVPPLPRGTDGAKPAVVGEERPGVRVGARQIRAPEVILGLDWDVLADVWSLGCMLAALYLGVRLFRVHGDAEHLAMIEHVLEVRVPPAMILRTSPRIASKGVAFDSAGRLDRPSPFLSHRDVEKIEGLPSLGAAILPRHRTFYDFLRGLLAVDPALRLGAEEALETSFCAAAHVTE